MKVGGLSVARRNGPSGPENSSNLYSSFVEGTWAATVTPPVT